MTNGGGTLVRRPLGERLSGMFKFGSCFGKGSSRSSDKKKASRANKGSSNETPKRTPPATVPNPSKPIGAVGRQHEQQQQLPNKPIMNPPVGAKIASHESPPPQLRRTGSVAHSRNNSTPLKGINLKSQSVSGSGEVFKRNPSSTLMRLNSTGQGIPVSGELQRSGSRSLTKSTSRNLSKLRDQYVRAMHKLEDMSHSVNLASANLGNSMTFDSRGFDSEVIRKRSQAENEIMELYLHSSIQPGEWKDARMGSRIMRNSSVHV